MKHAAPRRNWKTFFSTRHGAPRMPCHTSACLCLLCNLSLMWVCTLYHCTCVAQVRLHLSFLKLCTDARSKAWHETCSSSCSCDVNLNLRNTNAFFFFLHSLISLSEVAKEFDLVKPELVSDRMIRIQKGRHILQQQCVNTFVPNDFYSSVEDSVVKIFTGPNSSGKSVYLKQVASVKSSS